MSMIPAAVHERLLRLLSPARTREPAKYGRLYLILEDNTGKRVQSMTRTSTDQRKDANTVYAALELSSAIERGVDITPAALYRHIVGHDYNWSPDTSTCTMSVGCSETGICYAKANNQPSRCAATAGCNKGTAT